MTKNNKRHTKKVKFDGAVKQAVDVARARLVFIGAFFSLCFCALGFRVVDLAMASVDGTSRGLAAISTSEVKYGRADIVDRNGVLLATNLKTASLFADPKTIRESGISAEEVAAGLTHLFPELNPSKLLAELSSDKRFVWIKRNLSPKEQEAANNLGVPGLEFKIEEKRTYPHGELVAHLVGFTDIDGNGLSGAEREFNEVLSKKSTTPLPLSIDIRVQNILHRELVKKYQHHEAKGAAGMVMDVNSGEIIAMVSLPDFDPNAASTADDKAKFNNATLGVYEMGSTFKTFTMATALDNNLVTMRSLYDATNPIRVGRFTIRDHHGKKRWMTVPEIFMHSSNIGTAKIAEDIGSKRQREFLSKLGMLEPVALELPENGSPLYPDQWGRISTMTVSYGHGIAVTTSHVASAYSSMVNGGIYHSPTIIKDNADEGVRVIKQSTSDQMRKMLRLVVSEGTGKNANAKGYLVGGKTGTAEKAGVHSYDRKRMVSSFVAAFPMDNPRYVVMAVMDEPKGTEDSFGWATAGWTAAPVVKEVIAQAAPVLGVRPVDEESPEIRSAMHIDYEVGKDQKFASVETR